MTLGHKLNGKWNSEVCDMKKIMMMLLCVIMLLIMIMTVYTLDGRSIRLTELNNALNLSMESAMSQLTLAEGKPQTEDEWVSMFIESLVVQIDSASDLTVNILEADMEKGILSVEAILTFKHPIGTEGTVSTGIRTIILEEYTTE